MIENLNLFNKMNEGIIVVSEKDKSLKFASQPAIRLLKQMSLIQADDISLQNDDLTIKQKHIEKPIFEKIGVSIEKESFIKPDD